MQRQKVVFLYEGPHAVHAAWAKAIGAKFVSDLDVGPKKGSSWPKRFFNAFRRLFVLNRIPKDTNILLLEGGLGFVVGFLFKKFRKGKVIMICADPLFMILKNNKFLGRIGYFMLKDFDGFIAVSKMVAKLIPFAKKAVVHPFAEVSRFKKIKPNLKSNIIISVGRIDKRKGVDKMVEIFKKVKEKIPDAKFILLGEGQLKKQLEKANIKNLILPGYDKPEKYFKDCSLYLAYARYDPFPVSVIEAMAAGLVPIISKNVGMKDVLKDMSKELIAKNEEEAAKKIVELLKNKKKLRKLSIRIKQIGSEQTKEKSIAMFKKGFADFVT